MLRVVRSRPPELREETYTKHPDLWDQVTTFFFVRGSLTSFYKYEEWIYSIFTAEMDQNVNALVTACSARPYISLSVTEHLRSSPCVSL